MNVMIAKRFTFDAAHRLEQLPADHKCSRLHGHTYQVELVLQGPVHEDDGMVIDYADLADMWNPLHEMLDHQYLNGVRGLGIPTTEHVAGWIACQLLVRYPNMVKLLHSVRVMESSTTWCIVDPGTLTDDDFARYTR